MKIGCTPSELGLSEEEKIRPAYMEYVRMYGGEPECLEPTEDPETIREMVKAYDGFLITGGQDVDPSCYGAEREPLCEESTELRDTFEILLARECMRTGKPVFGICRGLQLLNVAYGGTLIQDIPTSIETEIVHSQKNRTVKYAHAVRTVPGTVYAGILGGEPFMVNSFHHQCVKDLAPGFAASILSPDGIIEGIECVSYPQIKAVQWHPERMDENEPFSKALMEDFLRRCEK